MRIFEILKQNLQYTFSNLQLIIFLDLQFTIDCTHMVLDASTKLYFTHQHIIIHQNDQVSYVAHK